MHRIGVVGISWRQRRADLLAALTIPREDRPARVPALAAAIGVRELVYVATCNRVEVAFAIEGRVPLSIYRPRIFEALLGREPRSGEAEHTLKLWHGEGAAEHLFLVASGLDSARVGEAEITTQVRDAVELSRALGLLGPRLERVLGEALKVARRVRPVTEKRGGQVSLAQIVVEHVRRRRDATGGAVALVGVSPMTTECARTLAALGVPLVIVNRTLAKAEALAAAVGGRACALDAFRADPPAVDVVVAATGAREPVLDRADLERLAARVPSGDSPLVIDLGVPPNVAPEDAALVDVPRIGMDAISDEAAHGRDRLLVEFADARALVDEALTELRRQAADRLVGPLVAELRRRYRHTAEEGVERLFERELAGLGEKERAVVRRWAETLARRFAHLPSVGLRDLAFHGGPTAVEAFFAGAEPELIATLAAAAQSGMELESEVEA